MNAWPFKIGATNLSLTSSWVSTALGAVSGDSTTEDLPSRGWLVGLDLRLTSISGASTVTFYLTEDANGLVLLTPHALSAATQTISLGLGAGTSGGVSWNLIRRPFALSSLYAHFKLDAGTATGSARLVGETGSAWRI